MSTGSDDEARSADTRSELVRLLETPNLVQVVPHLAPDLLHRLIRHAGVERCVEWIESTTPEQLATILDLDLWEAAPGEDDSFDAHRFGEWLESLVERDVAAAARLVVRFDRDLAITGLAEYVRVLDPGVLIPTAATDDEPWESPFDGDEGARAEIGGYLLRARREDAWDAVVALLVELSDHHPREFHDVIRGCRRLSNDGRERDGLDDLLDRPAQLRHEVSVARGERQGQRGFTSAGDARAFLAQARQPMPADAGPNPIAAAYLRDRGLERRRPRAAIGGTTAASAEASRAAAGIPGTPPHGIPALLDHLRAHHPGLAPHREQELAFLVNTLVSGCSLQARALTPREAADAAIATCDLGLLSATEPVPTDFLATHELVPLFASGWATLHREVSMAVAEGLLGVLRDLPRADSATLTGLHDLRQSLVRHLAAGAPWRVHEALDVLSTLDTPAWYGLLGLLGECPVIPAVVTAIVERQTGRIDPRRFEFIATRAHLETVRRFVDRLPGLLTG